MDEAPLGRPAAGKSDEPILLVHGEANNNSGTFPKQSEWMFQTLRGNGATVRYVTLPLESHGDASREATEQALFEKIRWLDKHVRNIPPRANRERETSRN